eukprot:sb/3475120/
MAPIAVPIAEPRTIPLTHLITTGDRSLYPTFYLDPTFCLAQTFYQTSCLVQSPAYLVQSPYLSLSPYQTLPSRAATEAHGLAAPRVNHAGFGARTRGDKLHNSLRKTTVTSHNFIRDPYTDVARLYTTSS